MLSFVLAFVVLSEPAQALTQKNVPTFIGPVTRISDGDTFAMLVDTPSGKREVKVRLDGVDAPEAHQEFGARAKEFTASHLFDIDHGKTVKVLFCDMDRYGRIVGQVHLPDGKILNREIVAAGYAWWFQKYAPKASELRDLQEQAKAAKKGLWADPNPVAPWDWRATEKDRRATGKSRKAA